MKTSDNQNSTYYRCLICGAEVPERFTTNTSYGHICLGCGYQLYNIIHNNKNNTNLHFTSSWNGDPVTYSMAQAAHDRYIPILNNETLQQEYIDFFYLALHIISDIEDDSGRWANALEAVCADYSQLTDINKDEIIIFVKSIINNKGNNFFPKLY